MTPFQTLQHHISGAIERGEGVAIIEEPTAYVALLRVAQMVLEHADCYTRPELIAAAEDALRRDGILR
jgi:hypothetical protein